MAHKYHNLYGKCTQDILDHAKFSPVKKRRTKGHKNFKPELSPLNPATCGHAGVSQPEIPISDPNMSEILRRIAARKLNIGA